MSAFPYKKLAVRIRFASCHKDKSLCSCPGYGPLSAPPAHLSCPISVTVYLERRVKNLAALNSKMANARVLRSPLRKLFVKSQR